MMDDLFRLTLLDGHGQRIQYQLGAQKCSDCPGCPLRDQCTHAKGNRKIRISFQLLKYRRFHLRGQAKVEMEWGLVSIAPNLKKLAA
jgi:hypothetical protein